MVRKLAHLGVALGVAAGVFGIASDKAMAAGCNGVVSPLEWGCAAWDNNNGPQFPHYKKPAAAAKPAAPAQPVVAAPATPRPTLTPNPSAGIVAAGAGNAINKNSAGIVAAGAGNAINKNANGIVAAGAGNAVNKNGSGIVAAGAGNAIHK